MSSYGKLEEETPAASELPSESIARSRPGKKSQKVHTPVITKPDDIDTRIQQLPSPTSSESTTNNRNTSQSHNNATSSSPPSQTVIYKNTNATIVDTKNVPRQQQPQPGSSEHQIVAAAAGVGFAFPYIVQHPSSKVVREADLKVYLALSIIACIIFFPLGIPAVIFAHKTKVEYYAGIQRGDMSDCVINAKRTEKCLVCALVFAVLVVIIIIGAVANVPQKSPRPGTSVTGLHG